MSNNNYKVIESKELSSYNDRRYIIVDNNGNILDDAQGYGYKTVPNAHRCWMYKNRDKSKDKEKMEKINHIKEWMRSHKGFVDAMNQFAFEIYAGKWGDGDKFDSKFVEKMLKDYNLEIDFKPSELLKVWRKF